jgi:hypothetical protein
MQVDLGAATSWRAPPPACSPAQRAGGAGHAPATSWCGLPTKVLATGRARAPRRLRHG